MLTILRKKLTVYLTELSDKEADINLSERFAGVLQNNCFQRFCKIHKKTSMRAWHKRFAVNFAKFLRAPFS